MRLSNSLVSNSGARLLLTEGEVRKLNTGKSHDFMISHVRIKKLKKHDGIFSILAALPAIIAGLAGAGTAAAGITTAARNINGMVKGYGVRLEARGKGVKHRTKREGILPLPLPLLPIAATAGLAGIGNLIKKKIEGKGVRLGARGKSIHHRLHGLTI